MFLIVLTAFLKYSEVSKRGCEYAPTPEEHTDPGFDKKVYLRLCLIIEGICGTFYKLH